MHTVLNILHACSVSHLHLFFPPPTLPPPPSLPPDTVSVTMPEMIAQTNMDAQAIARLREEISKFTVWLSRHSERFFVKNYEQPSVEYKDAARLA